MQKSYKNTVLTLVSCDKEFNPLTFAASPFFVRKDDNKICLEYIQDLAYSFRSSLKDEHYLSLIAFPTHCSYFPVLSSYINNEETCKKIIDIKFGIDESLVQNNRIKQQFENGSISFNIRRLKDSKTNDDYLFVSHPNIIIFDDFLEEKI